MAPRDLWRAWHEADRVAGIASIARRFFAMNAFDGVVTVLGMLAGGYATGLDDARVILTAGLSTCAAMGVSGLTGASLTEAAERRRSLDALQHQLLTDLDDTRIARASRWAVAVVALSSGVSPLVSGAVVLVPFALPGLPVDQAYPWAFAVGLATLAAVGLFLGRVSGTSPLSYAARTVAAGALALGVGLALGAVM